MFLLVHLELRLRETRTLHQQLGVRLLRLLRTKLPSWNLLQSLTVILRVALLQES